MTKSAADPTEMGLLPLLDHAYDTASWHGPNLKASIRGVSSALAAWRPNTTRHSIAEITIHAAYWKYIVRRRLLSLPRATFPLAGSNWFSIPEFLSRSDWRAIKTLLDDQHTQLRDTVSQFPAQRWPLRPAPSSPHTFAGMVQGIAFHDIYHAGQIQLLRRLQSSSN